MRPYLLKSLELNCKCQQIKAIDKWHYFRVLNSELTMSNLETVRCNALIFGFLRSVERQQRKSLPHSENDTVCKFIGPLLTRDE